MRIDVIANANARLYRKKPTLLDDARRICTGKARFHVTRDIAELDGTCSDIASRGSDLVVLSGGDGSFMSGLTALVAAFADRPLPRIALLPGGTVATVARNFGLSGSPIELLEQLICSPTKFGTRRSTTLRVRQTLGGQTIQKIGFMFGTGLVARFFDIYYDDGAGGYAAAARIASRVFVHSLYGGPYAQRVLEPMSCSIEADGAVCRGDRWSLVCAAVIKDVGIGMKVTYRAGEDTERVHLVASQLAPTSLGPRAPLVLLGKSIGGSGHVDKLVRSFVVRFSPEGPYVLDGDRLRAEEVVVTAGPVIDVVCAQTV